ncbi:MAG: PCI domain-containing protein [Promethearchaeota archaeon]
MTDIASRINRQKNITIMISVIFMIASAAGLTSVFVDFSFDNDDFIGPMIFSVSIGVLGVIILIVGLSTFKKKKLKLEKMGMLQPSKLSEHELKLKNLIKTYPRITLDDLSSKMNMTREKTEELVINMIGRGIVKGYIDPGTNTLISGEVSSEGAIAECPHCDAPLKTLLVKGTSVKCEACGELIIA